jgi:ATP-dependent helicase HrpB
MATLGVAPRLAHLVLIGAQRGSATLACELAALLAERDILRREAAELDADLRTRVEALRERGRASDVDRGRMERVRDEARALRRSLPDARDTEDDIANTGALLALAYPDRVAMRRAGAAPRYLLRNGRGARLVAPGALGRERFLAIADLDGDPAESRIWLAAPLDEGGVRAAAATGLVTEREVTWDAATGSVRAVERERIGALVLVERTRRDIDPAELADAIIAGVRAGALAAIAWSPASLGVRARLAFAHRHFPTEYPAVDDVALLERLDDWLRPALGDPPRLSRVDPGTALLESLPWALRARLDRLAPTHLEVPSGSRVAIDYTDPTAPVLAVRLQEVFGLTETPRIAEGRVAVTMHLLSPAHRPVQVTKDLASFWRGTYFEVRRDLKGRYPRHHWPDDPLAATPTRRVKPRGT